MPTVTTDRLAQVMFDQLFVDIAKGASYLGVRGLEIRVGGDVEKPFKYDSDSKSLVIDQSMIDQASKAKITGHGFIQEAIAAIGTSLGKTEKQSKAAYVYSVDSGPKVKVEAAFDGIPHYNYFVVKRDDQTVALNAIDTLIKRKRIEGFPEDRPLLNREMRAINLDGMTLITLKESDLMTPEFMWLIKGEAGIPVDFLERKQLQGGQQEAPLARISASLTNEGRAV